MKTNDLRFFHVGDKTNLAETQRSLRSSSSKASKKTRRTQTPSTAAGPEGLCCVLPEDLLSRSWLACRLRRLSLWPRRRWERERSLSQVLTEGLEVRSAGTTLTTVTRFSHAGRQRKYARTNGCTVIHPKTNGFPAKE